MGTRRDFLSGAATAALGLGLTQGARADEEDAGVEEGDAGPGADLVAGIPNFCAHEHWGSLPSIGTTDVGYRADEVAGAGADNVSLLDLLFDPYLHGFLSAGGFDTASLVASEGFPDFPALCRGRPDAVIRALPPHLANQRSTGTVVSLARGLRTLYGWDLDTLSAETAPAISGRIGANYRRQFAWYREAMRATGMSGPIRPVALSWFLRSDAGSHADDEFSFTRGVLRVDDYVQAASNRNNRVRYSVEKAGVDPHDAASWRGFLARVFDLARGAGCLGIKQLQAYRRDLDFSEWPDAEVDFAPTTPEAHRRLEDFVVHECCRLANDLAWPFQIHIGTNNLPRSNPLPLTGLADRYPRVKFVLIHCWPYIDECAYLAKLHPNVYLDTCWLPILSTEHLERALRTFLGYVPAHKLMASQDATSVELAAGASALARGALGRLLAERVGRGEFPVDHARWAAECVLRDNALSVYGVPAT